MKPFISLYSQEYTDPYGSNDLRGQTRISQQLATPPPVPDIVRPTGAIPRRSTSSHDILQLVLMNRYPIAASACLKSFLISGTALPAGAAVAAAAVM